MNLTDKISEHFTYEEVISSNKAQELGINNELPSEFYGNVENLAKYILEPIRLHFGMPVIVSSWYRCIELNKIVGGSKTSDHMIGAAADIILPKASLIALGEYIRDNLDFDQIIHEPTWIHVSYKKDNNRKQVLRNENGKYLLGII